MKKRSLSLQTHLLVWLAVMLVPLLLFATIAAVQGAKQLHENRVQQLQSNAAVLASTVNQRFISYAQVLHLQAITGTQPTSSYLHRLQAEPQLTPELTFIDLRDPQQKAALPEAFLEQLASNPNISVSDLFHHPVTNTVHVLIGLPSNAMPTMSSLALRVPPTAIIDLSQIAMADGTNSHHMALFDSQGHLVTRSHNSAQSLGQIAPYWSKLQGTDASPHWPSIETFEDAHMLVAFTRLDIAKDWMLVVAQEQPLLMPVWSTPVWAIVLGLLVTAAATYLLARWGRQRLVRPLQRLQEDSRALIDGSTTHLRATDQASASIQEFETISTHVMQAQARMDYLAQYDPLTGLVNRSHFLQLLANTIAANETSSTAILSMDLDRFIHINDSLGHAVGDALLQHVTARLMELLPRNGLLARLGGDEFAILFTTKQPQADIEQLGTRILRAFQDPFVIDSHRIIANTCIGAAWSQSHTDQPERIMRHAELALHCAKADSRKPLRFFDPSMEQLMQQHRQMEVDLRYGLDHAQFYLVYQPLVDLHTLRLVGFEALLRWQHPTMGVLTPGRFIHIAEELGLMDRLGAWVLQQACQDAREWQNSHLSVAVNIAASQLNDQLALRVSQTLTATGLPPQQLELEVTENALIGHIAQATDSLLQLQAQGVSIVLDDFGTGFTSLSHLRAFPFNKVKIDKGFVNDLSISGHEKDGEAIISAVALLCKRLGIVAVAEGIETRRQMQFIVDYECQQAQGFLFGRPLTQAETGLLIACWPKHALHFHSL